MKIYNSVSIDMKTLEVVEEDSFEYEGPLMLCGGGGGSAGSVQFPTEISDVLDDWLGASGDFAGTNVSNEMEALQGNSPYATVNSFNPDAFVSAVQSRFDYYDTLVKAIDEHTDWDTFFDNVKDKVDSIISDSYIESVVDEYDDDTKDEWGDTINRFAGGMAEINAINSSAFIIGMALMENQRLRAVRKLRASLVLDFEKVKLQMYQQGLNDMIRMYAFKLDVDRAATQTLAEINRVSAVLKKEQYIEDIELDVEDTLWDIKVFQYGGRVMASPSGAAPIPDKPSKAASALGGALSGAAQGAAIGGPIGAVVGAGAGYVAGGGDFVDTLGLIPAGIKKALGK